MGIFNTLLGNATNTNPVEVEDQIGDILYSGEEVMYAFSYVRDLIVFTTGRIIFIDKQGVTGKKKEIQSIPYKNISRFSIETSGHFDEDSEIKIWVSGVSEPIVREFSGDKNIVDVQKLIAQVACSR